MILALRWLLRIRPYLCKERPRYRRVHGAGRARRSRVSEERNISVLSAECLVYKRDQCMTSDWWSYRSGSCCENGRIESEEWTIGWAELYSPFSGLGRGTCNAKGNKTGTDTMPLVSDERMHDSVAVFRSVGYVFPVEDV